jgi:hypothetical protein
VTTAQTTEVVMQIAQIIGAILILAAFAALQFGRSRSDGTAYLIANAVGSAILGVVAVLGDNWGFLLLEGVWAIVSTWALVQKARGRSVAGAH